MNIFIETYHLVKKVIDYPKTLIEKQKQDKIAREQKIEQEERNKRLIAETMGTISTVEAARESLDAKEQVDNRIKEVFSDIGVDAWEIEIV